MAMDFFNAQQYHKKISFIFYGLFCLMVLLHIFLMLIVCLVATKTLTGNVDLSYWFFGIVLLFLYIAFGVFVQQQKVATGGRAVAEKMAAVRLLVAQGGEAVYRPNFIRTPTISELPSGYARVYEFAEQMSIASGVALPLLYVLPNEMGVNAFVAGFDRQDTVLVLTQGAVDTLDNDSLYGLIGHEFGHILHGDARLNLRIYVMMSGLSWLYECAEWLSDGLLGDYKKPPSRQPQVLHSHTDWVRYWQGQNASYRREYTAGHNADPQGEAAALLFVLPLTVLLVALRLFGVIGMASHEWIVAQFNRQREFLADATSIQLTRSLGVVKLLQQINKGTPTAIGVPYSTHMGHFFFASTATDTLFDTHPSISERLLALGSHRYQDFGRAVTEHLDKDKLQKAHDSTRLHTPIVPLSQQINYDSVEFDSVPDKVVDGRLLVDKAWYDWGTADEDSVFDNARFESACRYRTDSNVYDKDQTVAVYADLKTADIAWQISRHERRFVGTIALVHTLLAVKNGLSIQNGGEMVTLGAIYGIDTKEPIFPHSLDKKLLQACIKTDDRMYGMLIVRAIRAMGFHLNNANIPLTASEIKLKANYQAKIRTLIEGDVSDFAKNHKLDYKRLLSKADKLFTAGVLAAVMLALDEQQMMDTKADFTGGVLQNDGCHLTKEQQLVLCLLLLVVGTQDNSLLINKIEKIRQALLRFCRLMDTALVQVIEQVNDEALAAMLHRTHLVSVGDWAGGFVLLSGQKRAFRQRVFEVLHTAFLYDGQLTQKEYDCLCLIAQLFGCKFDKIVVQ